MSDQPGAALITGASSGIGVEFARLFAARGYDCIVTARRTERLEALKAELEKAHSVSVYPVAHDLSAPDSAESLAATVDALDRPVSVLVNNAGFGVWGKVLEHDWERAKAMIELDMTSLTTLTYHYGKQMVARGGGHILQVSSVGAYQPAPYYAIYSAAKAYVLSFSAAMNWELKGTNVSITTICPGLTATEFHAAADHLKPKSMDRLTMSAESVAAIGVKAMFRRRAVITPGAPNKLMAFFVKLLPRGWSTAMAGKMMAQRREE